MFKDSKRKYDKVQSKFLEQVRHERTSFKVLKKEDLRIEYQKLKERYSKGSINSSFIAKHHALVSEVIKRTLKIEPFDSQIVGGFHLIDHNIIEMKTGEGKTLTAVFATSFHALGNQGVHVLTFNDYLSERDANWMRPIADFLGLTIGFITEDSEREERKKAYACDITYVTAREAGFDYLRDGMIYAANDNVHRKFNVAIIDEADSILIDEARVPLIISKNRKGEHERLKEISAIVKKLKFNEDFESSPETNQVYLTDKGLHEVEVTLGIKNLYSQSSVRTLNYVNLALHAHFLLKKDDDYIIREDQVEQVDQFTGRVADKRRWADGLQAAIEAKEGLTINAGSQLLGSITLRDFLKQYAQLSGMTGTALSSAKELQEVYELSVVPISTEKPLIRKDKADKVFAKTALKEAAIVEEVLKTNGTGQPVLVGTESVEASERIAEMLSSNGIKVNLLNAKVDAKEAEIISQAGRLNQVTVSTAMAGRGTDIKLGNDDLEEHIQVKSVGGLYVIGTYKHESKRIDDQLRGRAGRQGDPGKSQFFISLEDQLLSDVGVLDFLPQKIKSNLDKYANHPVTIEAINKVQQKVEEQNQKIRKTLNTYSEIVERQRKIFQEDRHQILVNGFRPSENVLSSAQKSDLKSEYSEKEIAHFYNVVALTTMDDAWSMHLHLANEVKESIHLSSLARLSPSNEFQKIVAEAFIKLQGELLERIEDEIIEKIQDNEGRAKLMDQVANPSSTYTELITDQPFGEWMELLYVPASGAKFTFAKLFFWPILGIFKKRDR
ncbi:accessory Sec system translocase SecA2 [Roseivirga sp.]|uniref:preprotein translocase subunit SecA n=1 Tax=Roseivirga sp. TaxID=1964215 RepID=UPI003B8CDFD2